MKIKLSFFSKEDAIISMKFSDFKEIIANFEKHKPYLKKKEKGFQQLIDKFSKAVKEI